LLNFNKKDLEFISKHVFNFFINDASNNDTKFTRIKIRKLINEFQNNGLDKAKLFLTLKNLKKSNHALSFYVEKNKKLNSFFYIEKKELVLSEFFFNHPYEIVFRSISDSIKLVGNKYNAVRGKKIDYILEKIRQNSLKKETLGGCVIKKVNQTVIISKEC
jgi:tRNA(Ile)-lysidine synthase